MATITCPISGEILVQSNLMLGFHLAEQHPIFRAKKELVLTPDMIYKFQSAQSVREKKLYFLAALNTTDLIDFHVPANPAHYIMENSFFDILTLATWVDYARFKVKERINFPRYSVTKDSFELKNISVWINTLYDIRNLFLEKNRQEDLKQELNELAQQIEKEFKRASYLGQAFTPNLAKWALDLTQTTSGVYEKWKKIMLTPLEDAWTIQKDDLYEIQEHLQAELPINNDQAIAVLHQIQKLITKSREGFTAFTFIEDEGTSEGAGNEQTISSQSQQQNYSQTEEVNEEEEAELIAMLPPLGPEPRANQFIKHFLFLKAHATWKMERAKREPKRKGSGYYDKF